MPKPTDIRICDVQAKAENIDYRSPMKFGGRVVSDVTLLHVSIRVETCDGRQATGLGSMPMGNVWGWPSQQVSGEQSLAAMVQLGKRLAELARQYDGEGHPLRIAQQLSGQYSAAADTVTRDAGLPEPMPRLAQMVAGSPIEAALFDAYGKALGENTYRLLGEAYVDQDLAGYLGAGFEGEYLDRYTLRDPKPRMPLYHLVGALDPLTETEVNERPDDGLPMTLGEWIHADGLTHLKIKLDGANLRWDVDRVVAVDRVAAGTQSARGCDRWSYSLDFNERCANVEYLLDFLGQLDEQCPAALGRVQYLEQPTHRDLKAHPENRMHRAAQIKPVVIDESLVDLESLLLCRELGYSGVALKACKGQSETLLMGAAAQKFEMFLCVQDLTCPGASFLHSTTLAARIPTVAAIEGNARQYCPAGNRHWQDQYPSMFEITDGTVGTHVLTGPGLGY